MKSSGKWRGEEHFLSCHPVGSSLWDLICSICTEQLFLSPPSPAHWSGPSSKAVPDVFWVFSWSLFLVERPASYFPLELALGSCSLRTHWLFASLFSVCLGNIILCNQITRCWMGGWGDGKCSRNSEGLPLGEWTEDGAGFMAAICRSYHQMAMAAS